MPSNPDLMVDCVHGINTQAPSPTFTRFTPARVHICTCVHSEEFTQHLPRVGPCAWLCPPPPHTHWDGCGRLQELSLTRRTDVIVSRVVSSPWGFIAHDLGAKRGHSAFLLVSGPGAVAEMLFSFLSFPVPRASPPTASPGRPCARTPLSLAAQLKCCLNVRRNSGKGKERKGTKGPGGTREAVGGPRPWSPALALPGPFGTSSTRAARRLSKGRARHAPGLLWEGNTKEREKQVFRFDGGDRQLQEA